MMKDENYEFSASLWVDNIPKADLISRINVRRFNEPENRMYGTYKVFKGADRDRDATIFIYQTKDGDKSASFKVRTGDATELISTAMIKYRDNGDLPTWIEAIAGNFLDASLEVQPNNRMFGSYELMEAPRVIESLGATKDAFTRDHVDYQSVNWGDDKRMTVGVDHSNPTHHEKFESFVEFDISNLGSNKVIEKATMRLHYSGVFEESTPLEFRTNDTYWNEMGITNINKPNQKEFITDKYTINKRQQYIDVDLTDVVNKWFNRTDTNYGINIYSSADKTVAFYTRESVNKVPTLYVQYIDLSKSFTSTRYDKNAMINIIGTGREERNGTLLVKSDVGISTRDAELFVHRPESPVYMEKTATLIVNRAELASTIFTYKKGRQERNARLTVSHSKVSERPASINANKPELGASIIIDPKAHLYSTIRAKALVENDPNAQLISTLSINHPETKGFIEIKSKAYLDAFITVKPNKVDERDATIGIPTYVGDKSPVGRDDGDIQAVFWNSVPEIIGTTFIYIPKDEERDATIRIFERTELTSVIAGNQPELHVTMQTKIANSIDATINVRGSSFLNSSLIVHHKSEIEGSIIINQTSEVEADISASRPEFVGTIFRRYAEDADKEGNAIVRKRDVADLHCRFGARGSTGGAYYFII
ncbi:DNRLRE domain-containing protein [Paenibacillus agilis]|uniref:DNRLRE domain-containing protein n=1 Tax=Paenibacillus agilis TaxID=3020863 RepID=A0A559IEK5_9BACL|nr:DNRLRE domain-containing protein [Paenibacillus agilis]TVX86098.1 DNRLRE domain-containing protein [Paenibacillus agilis]